MEAHTKYFLLGLLIGSGIFAIKHAIFCDQFVELRSWIQLILNMLSEAEKKEAQIELTKMIVNSNNKLAKEWYQRFFIK